MHSTRPSSSIRERSDPAARLHLHLRPGATPAGADTKEALMPGAALILALSLAHAPAATQPPPRGMIIAASPNVETLIARRADDGTLETACVDSDDAAKAFFARKTKSTKAEQQ